ncbi:signal recognition particle-docking protein FtsY [Xanthobacter oligotrophicus]|uniref:signal recognition particle-docking protein FtsY n=1 Tax=Xanthobacter oligotrophicus TaxID=2607286 RepID=UPI001E418332|nr:signal recognition particle-docking protein FtsY [Xanthobacter oligotrophicus]MCG5235519.1 signal recognition particle-docking protein FtsY [Xanthobacter oligotrophicus]
MSDNDRNSPADAQKKKRGLWGWLKSGFEDPVPRFTHDTPQEAGAPAEEAREAAPVPSGDAPAAAGEPASPTPASAPFAPADVPPAPAAEAVPEAVPAPVAEVLPKVLVEEVPAEAVAPTAGPAFGAPIEQPTVPTLEPLVEARIAVEVAPPVPADGIEAGGAPAFPVPPVEVLATPVVAESTPEPVPVPVVEPEPKAPDAEASQAIASESVETGTPAFAAPPEQAPVLEAPIFAAEPESTPEAPPATVEPAPADVPQQLPAEAAAIAGAPAFVAQSEAPAVVLEAEPLPPTPDAQALLETPPVAGPLPVDLPPVEATEAVLPAAESFAVAPAPVGSEPQPAKKGFWSRLAEGLARTASNLGQGITDLVSKRKLDADTLEELEDVLIRADLGVETSMRIVETVGKGRHDKMISPEEVKRLIAEEVERILIPVAQPLVVDTAHKPFVVLMVGVNGSGKTTTIGKLAAQWRTEGKKVVLAAGDTFRAAAIEQLKVWGARSGATVIAREQGSDAAGVAHEAVVEARATGADILMVDTAGRLQNRTELMAELEKVVRVIKKLEPSAPHAVLLVLDATVGQNALSQVEAFTRIAGVTGLVMTKLDGTARGGILVAIAAKHKLPVHLIGVGEAAEDLQPFAARDFARAIAGLN